MFLKRMVESMEAYAFINNPYAIFFYRAATEGHPVTG
jgi:hypothetical protein